MSDQPPSGYSGDSLLSGAGGAAHIIAMRGGANDLDISSLPLKITWNDMEFTLEPDFEKWSNGPESEQDFLDVIGVPKDANIFSGQEDYTIFIKGLEKCTGDAAGINSKCTTVNNILIKIIKYRLDEVASADACIFLLNLCT